MSDNKMKQSPSRGNGRGFKRGEKPKDFKGTVKKLFDYLAVYKIQLTVVILCAVGAMIFAVVSPRELGN